MGRLQFFLFKINVGLKGDGKISKASVHMHAQGHQKVQGQQILLALLDNLILVPIPMQNLN